MLGGGGYVGLIYVHGVDIAGRGDGRCGSTGSRNNTGSEVDWLVKRSGLGRGDRILVRTVSSADRGLEPLLRRVRMLQDSR